MILIALLAFVILFIVLTVINFIFAKRLPKDTVIALTGGLGTGKTLLGVNESIKRYKKLLFLYAIGQLNETVPDATNKKKKKKIKAELPLLYSNIPIKIKTPLILKLIKKNQPKYQFSKILTYEHLILQERLNQHSVIFIDELGQFADQYSYDNPFVQQYLQTFIRFYRHMVDGSIIVTDQNSDNIVVTIRRRINVIYNLVNFRRYLGIFFKVDVIPLLMVDAEGASLMNQESNEFEYFTGHLPFKYFKVFDIVTKLFGYKKYESRVYRPLYDGVQFNVIPEMWTDYYTKYLIDIPNNQELKKLYKAQGFITQKQMLKATEDWRSATAK